MAKHDIMPFVSTLGGHTLVRSLRADDTATYRQGEWVILTPAVGTADMIQEVGAGTENILPTTHFIAASDSQGDLQRITDPRYGDPPNSSRLDLFYSLMNSESQFITRNVYTGNDTLIDISTVLIGDPVGGWVTAAGVHGVDTAATGLIVTRILNAQKNDTGTFGGTATWLVFQPGLATS